MQKVNYCKLIFATIYTISLIIAFVGSFVASYYISALVTLGYYETTYGWEYNMTTGCMFNDTYCESGTLDCYEPFYQNCTTGGIIGLIIGGIITVFIFAIILACSCATECCDCCFAVDESNETNKTNKTTKTNDNEIELSPTNNKVNENNETFVVVDLNEKSLPVSPSTRTSSSSFVNLSSLSSSNTIVTINENSEIGTTSTSF